MSAPLPPALAATFDEIADGINDLYATRYFTCELAFSLEKLYYVYLINPILLVACFTVLLYDHLLLFIEEVSCWRSILYFTLPILIGPAVLEGKMELCEDPFPLQPLHRSLGLYCRLYRYSHVSFCQPGNVLILYKKCRGLLE